MRVIAEAPAARYYATIALERGSGAIFLKDDKGGGNAVSLFDSYRDVLSEHARGKHVVVSAWLIAAAIAVFAVFVA